jgi:HEPN domain-containing protein
MVNIEQQINYWRKGACEDWEVAHELIRNKRIRHGLFFAHLALEKALKAHICRQTRDLAPRTHNLVRLAELTALPIPSKQTETLAEMNSFNIEGRYPDTLSLPPEPEEAIAYLKRAGEVFEWLMSRL